MKKSGLGLCEFERSMRVLTGDRGVREVDEVIHRWEKDE